MSQLGPGDKPKVVRRRAARQRRQQQQRQARAAESQYVSQGRAVRRAATRQRARQETQQAAQHARPLAAKPVRPKPVQPVSRKVKPLAATPPQGVKAGKPVRDAQQRRAVAVAAYNQLSGDAKRGHLAGARKRALQGKPTETDVAILHAHSTRVAGNRKRVAAAKAFDVLSQPKGLSRDPRVELAAPVRPHELKANVGSVADLRGVGPVVAALGAASTKGLEKTPLPKVIKNIPKDAAELAVTSPSSIAKFVVDAVKHPEKAPGKLIAPYKELAKHPGKFVTEHPVSTVLMLDPAVRVPGRAAGKVARLAGKQTLARPAATLANTALREERIGSRSIGRRAVQARKDRRAATPVSVKAPRQASTRLTDAIHEGNRLTAKFNQHRDLANVPAELWDALDRNHALQRRLIHEEGVRAKTPVRPSAGPQMTARGIDRRVDEAYAAAQKHTERVRNSILRDAHKQAKRLPKTQRQAHLDAASEQAGAAAVAAKRRLYAQEFGATARVENGRVVPTAQAHMHDSLADAHAVKDHLNAQAQTIKRGSGSLFEGGVGAKLYPKEKLDVEYTVRDAGHGKYAVMPKQVADRLNVHGRIGKEKAVPAVVLRQSRRLLTRAVLPSRPTWLSGQTVEGGARTGIAGGGPTSWMRAHRYKTRHPDLYKAAAERAVPGGQIGQAVAREMTHRTFAQEVPESQVARAFTDLGKKPGIRQVRNLHDAYVRFVFDHVNGKVLEGIPQKTILGRAMIKHPLMERRIIGLSNKAIDEFARGQKGTETHVTLSRELERSFGKWQAYSPRLRSLVMHWTPFIPWWINSARFILQTLPRDHPIATALIADISAAEGEWRKEQGLSLRYRNDKSLPPWMLGGYPIQGGRNLARLGHYLPGGSETDPVGSLVGQVLPQFSGAYGALRYGKDFKGADLKHADGAAYNGGERILYGAAQLIESMIPFTAQGAQIAHLPEVLGGPSESDASTTKQRIVKQVRPISTVPLNRKPKGLGLEVPGLELSPLQLQQIQLGG